MAPSRTILIIEDEIVSEILCLGLTRREYTVHAVADIIQGREKCLDVNPDLVLIGAREPRREVILAFLEWFRRGRRDSSTPVIVLLTYISLPEVYEFFLSGADACVLKPFSLSELWPIMKELLSQDRQERLACVSPDDLLKSFQERYQDHSIAEG